ncbi:hypothetical protein KOI40_01010 [Aestuariicella sp. G3-2]|uniref:hypothetical protein n=1 Tax=Pseudomaricurvus albidus TaxID=2842452 RepID=UPI001C0AC4B3|nr:hypothetical protein [Aestuariicella albida]MBU3068373.1 hypothetical protein [Aestuariicella albida]
MDIFSPVLSLLLSAGGVGCLYAAWRQKQSAPLLIAFGWGGLLVSLVTWSGLLGVEFGVTYALIALSLVAWLLVGLSAGSSRVKLKAKPSLPLSRPLLRTLGKHTGLLFLAVVLAGVVAAFVGVGVLRVLPMERANTVIVSILLFPLVWGGLSCWYCAAERLLKPVLISVAAGALGALAIFL